MHHRQRVVLELFHALSDGTGALWFLSDLVTAYVGLRYPEQDHQLGDAGETCDALSHRGRPESRTRPVEVAEQALELTGDSSAHHLHRRRRRSVPGSDAAFGRAAAPAVLTVEIADRSSPVTPRELRRSRRSPRTKTHRITGTRTPDNRTRVVELTVPTAGMLALARAEGVSLTMYLTAAFFESVRRSSGDLTKTRTLAASVPLNLRQFFPSTSPRNFFATIRVQHTYGAGADDLGSICRQLENQFRPKATREALERKLRSFLRFECRC
jgi:hypothetical protein